MTAPICPAIGDIYAAAARIDGAVLNTPFVPSQTLSRITGCELWLKFENLQFVASFKERGALNALLCLSSEQRARGVIAISAGNHAQGVAYHASRLGIRATIVMPIGTPKTKVSRTIEHGATVVVRGSSFADAAQATEEIAREKGLTLVHPFDNPHVIAGQGTVALEMLGQEDGFDAFVVPIGGGGLISGMAIAARHLAPKTKIIGVQTHAYHAMKQLLGDAADGENADQAGAGGITIAEGIAVKTPGTLTRDIVQELIDDIVLVSEEAVERAVALLLSIEKTVVEGAGAAALAAILEHPKLFQGKKVGIPLTGGNIDSRMLASVIMRDLIRSGQLIRLHVPISDQPGALAELATTMGEQGANIVEIAHDRLSLALNPKGAMLDVVLELQDPAHGEQLVGVLQKRGWKPFMAPMSAMLAKGARGPR